MSGGSAAKRKVFKVSEKNKEMKLSLVACRILLATIFIQNFNVHANGRGKVKCTEIYFEVFCDRCHAMNSWLLDSTCLSEPFLKFEL